MTMTWSDALIAWRQEMLAGGMSTETIKLYMYYLRRWERVCAHPQSATRNALVAFQACERWAPNTRKSVRTALVSFYTWMYDEKLLPPNPDGTPAENPAGRLPAVSVPTPEPRPATDEAISEGLLRASVRVWLMIMLGAIGGLRRAEISRVHRSDLDGNRLRVHGKGGRIRTIDLPDIIAERIREAEGWVFPVVDIRHPAFWGRHLTPDYVGKLITRALPKDVTPHQLRHAAATQLHELGVPLEEIQIFLGHKQITTTMLYTKVRPKYTTAATLKAAARFAGPRIVHSRSA
jgi:integrase